MSSLMDEAATGLLSTKDRIVESFESRIVILQGILRNVHCNVLRRVNLHVYAFPHLHSTLVLSSKIAEVVSVCSPTFPSMNDEFQSSGNVVTGKE